MNTTTPLYDPADVDPDLLVHTPDPDYTNTAVCGFNTTPETTETVGRCAECSVLTR